jgi:Spy/CpxP family protein refolding chaperone
MQKSHRFVLRILAVSLINIPAACAQQAGPSFTAMPLAAGSTTAEPMFVDLDDVMAVAPTVPPFPVQIEGAAVEAGGLNMVPPVMVGVSGGPGTDCPMIGPAPGEAACPIMGGPMMQAMMMRMHGGHGPEGIFRGLNLSDDQYEKMFALKKSTMAKMGPKMAEMGICEMDLHDMMLQPEADKSKVMDQQARINSLRSEMANVKVESELSMLAILTPEQRKELRRGLLRAMAGGMHPHR